MLLLILALFLSVCSPSLLSFPLHTPRSLSLSSYFASRCFSSPLLLLVPLCSVS